MPKQYLVIDRLTPLIRRHGIESLDRLVDQLRRNPASPLWDEVIDAMTTNETSFFRDSAPFTALGKCFLPPLLEAAENEGREVRLWSAACSSGQEAFSLAMLAHEVAPRQTNLVKIVGSDVSNSMLQRAQQGLYTSLETSRGLSETMIRRYFSRVEEMWQVRDEIRNMVSWMKFSLVDPWPAMKPFDVILLRNVLVYFDEDSKRKVLDGVRRVLRPGGVLLMGGAESSPLSREYFSPIGVEGCTFLQAKTAPLVSAER
jgi:chemotaxis protein methyltransferase CheR